MIERRKNRNKIKYWKGILQGNRKFWSKQPTLREDVDQDNIFGNIEGERKVEEVRQEPLDLPSEDMRWCEINIGDEKEL